MPQVPARPGPDGVVRPAETEDRLNGLFLAWTQSELGQECMAHLRQITLESVCGPLSTAEELRHREGGRFLVALIQTRAALGAQKKHDDAHPPKPAEPRQSRTSRIGRAALYTSGPKLSD